ncbi:MAG: hypothetical protein QF921_18135 [Pseudomonadales bacterium]|nr:hypothetical protein [Pseudomonadales bacterium]MDP6470462.1 hypothetical protein [Pseudomonadales bacterium]MDP6827764.1 hypothetical protein [Pseudomonadales bacterium]MDP6973406.1 hypothetical protein [Pseudomonadales bacterium]
MKKSLLTVIAIIRLEWAARERGDLRHADPHMLLWLAGWQLPERGKRDE